MNSTKPITSAEPTPRRAGSGVAIAAAALALAVAGANVMFAQAGRSISAGLADLATAQAQPASVERDQVLDRAQQRLRDGLALASGDAAGWNGLAEVRFLQATQASVGVVSPVLLANSLEASRRARALAPADADAALRIAAIRARAPDGAAEARDALRWSYEHAPGPGPMTLRRIAAAGRLWPGLDAAMRAKAVQEVCAAAALDPRMARAFARAASDIEDPDAAAIDQVASEAACARS